MSKHAQFWNKEYKTSEHLRLSDEPAEDLEKFTRWAERNYGRRFLNPLARALDLGCGNGRNLIFLAQHFGVRGVGYDISSEAIKLAERASKELPITYAARPIEGAIDLPDNSVDIVLDMMTSHFLKEKEREELRTEILRVLKPGGQLVWHGGSRDGVMARFLARDWWSTEDGTVFGQERRFDPLSEGTSRRVARGNPPCRNRPPPV